MKPAKEITAALEPFVKVGSLAGVVTVVGDEKGILALNTLGAANIEAGAPMRADSMFWIASQTKPMTATALLMLVDEGKLGLDDPVEKHLPEYKDIKVIAEKTETQIVLRKPATVMTVRHVLSHMAGLPFTTFVEYPTLDALPLRTAVRSYASTPLNTEPGSTYVYSNAGTNTAGRLIEVLSGMPYETFMQERLFTPLGMTDTTFFPSTEQVGRLVQTYKVNEEKTGFRPGKLSQLSSPLDAKFGRYPMPAGGLFATAVDCYRFCQMMLCGGAVGGRKYVSPNAFGELTRRQTPADSATSYGLSYSVDPDSFGHGGAYSTKMLIYPAKKLVTVFLVQHDGLPTAAAKVQDVFKDAVMAAFS